jgi:hypothetical protein
VPELGFWQFMHILEVMLKLQPTGQLSHPVPEKSLHG